MKNVKSIRSKKYISLNEIPFFIEDRCPRTFQKIKINKEQWAKLLKDNEEDIPGLVVNFVGLEISLLMPGVDRLGKEIESIFA